MTTRSGAPRGGGAHDDLLDAVRRAARQEQFLDVVSAEEAQRRFTAGLVLAPRPGERIALAEALGRVLSDDVIASIDVPPFDRANVDGFALRALDTAGAADAAPKVLALNAEIIACGHAPQIEVASGSATTIATGGVVPRGADAVVMIESTELIESGPAISLRRAVPAGQFISYAGSDIARGETVLRKGRIIGSREIGMLAACGVAEIMVVRRPRVAVLSTGDELTSVGDPLPPASVYDSNGPIIAAAVVEAGGQAVIYGAFADDESVLEQAVRDALRECDMVVLSGGTSKGAGDLSHRIVNGLGKPGVLVHGVALKPGKPLCLAVVDGKPVVVLPGFPTSAIFTFHTFVAPVIRAYAGLPPEASDTVEARVPMRVASELGRKEFLLVSLIDGEGGRVALPSAKGSGAVTSFSASDGFIEIDALAHQIEANTVTTVNLISRSVRAPDLVITGSHDVALDAVASALSDRGWTARIIAVGSQGGVAAALRGECDLAPVHLMDPATGVYNRHLLVPGLSLIKGWTRMQGVLYRKGDERFESQDAAGIVRAALSDPRTLMVNRNAGAGTRVLIDRLLAGARPGGYANQPKSHNAVAVAVAQGRADWGMAIEPAAAMYGLGFAPLVPEEYDFIVVDARRERPAVKAFLEALRDGDVRARIQSLGMRPAD